ncbi:MAG: Hpt domain-containing protein, partial [Myxococcota bacterium]
MSKYKKMFVDEAGEHLANAAQHLVDLEKAPQDSTLINELFRNAHSIKGMAASLGYEEISDLSHILEDLLDLYRCEKRILDAQAIDTLLRAVDFTERMVGEVDADKPISDPAAMIREIRGILADDAPADVSGKPATEARPGPAQNTAPPSGESAERQQAAGCLRIVFRVAADSVSPGARGFLGIRKLSTLGTLRRLRPEMEAIKAGRYGRVVEADLETERGPDEVTQALSGVPEIVGVRIESVSTGSTLVGADERSAPRTPAAPGRGQSSTVRVKTEALDRFVDAVGEIILNKSELREIARDLGSEALMQGLSRLDVSLEELKRQAMNVRLTPLERALAPLPRLVRDVARSHDKEVRLEIRGADLELDRAIVDALNEPLIHLVRNALDHGLETPLERTGVGKGREG